MGLAVVVCVGCGGGEDSSAPPVTSAADAKATPPANSKWTAENQQKYHEALQNSRAGVEATGPATTPGPTYSTDNPDDPIPPTSGGTTQASGGASTGGTTTGSSGRPNETTKASDGSGVVIGK
ncbi:MAG: hypothetical protein ABL962_05640 [Fimbriimonadaceae bacterium]